MLNTDQQKNMILNIVFDNLEVDDDGTGFLNYLDHIGFDIVAVTDTKELPAAILGHYRIKQGLYDVDKAAMDLATYGPIASALVERLTKQKSLAN